MREFRREDCFVKSTFRCHIFVSEVHVDIANKVQQRFGPRYAADRGRTRREQGRLKSDAQTRHAYLI